MAARHGNAGKRSECAVSGVNRGSASQHERDKSLQRSVVEVQQAKSGVLHVLVLGLQGRGVLVFQ